MRRKVMKLLPFTMIPLLFGMGLTGCNTLEGARRDLHHMTAPIDE